MTRLKIIVEHDIPVGLLDIARRVALHGIEYDAPDWPGLEFEPREVWVSLQAKLEADDLGEITAAEKNAWSSVFEVMGQDEDECSQEDHDAITKILA